MRDNRRCSDRADAPSCFRPARPGRLTAHAFTVTVVAALSASPALAASSAPLTPATPVQRLARLAEIWARVRLTHPGVYSRDLDWDGAWLRAAPRAEAAATPAAFRDAVALLVAELKDPVTRLAPTETPDCAPPTAPRVEVRRKVVVLTPASEGSEDAVEAALRTARAVVVDLRCTPRRAAETLFQTHTALHPGRPTLVLSRLLSWRTEAAPMFLEERVEQPTPRVGKGPRIVLLVDEDAPLTVATPLLASGEAEVVATSPVNPGALVYTEAVPVDGESSLVLRASELLSPAGRDPFQADKVVPAGSDPLDVAVEQALRPAHPHPAQAGGWGSPGALPPVGSEAPFPERPARQLAAVKVWWALKYFWAWRGEHEALVDGLLPEALTRVGDARDAASFGLALLDMVGQVPDSHAVVWGPAVRAWTGGATVAATLLPVGREYVVARAGPGAEALHPGEVLLTIDGRPMEERTQQLQHRYAASHDAGHAWKIAEHLLDGPPGPARVTLRGRGGATREVTLTRTKDALFWEDTVPTAWALLPGDVGYVHLPSLPEGAVPRMLGELSKARALVLDDRGYPSNAIFDLAPCLGTRSPTGIARFERDVPGLLDGKASSFLQEPWPCQDAPRWTGPVVLLVDGRAQSRSEHTWHLLEAWAGVTVVGSPSQGTNGEVGTWNLPGGLRFAVTVLRVYAPDGRTVQHLGVPLQVEARPTVEGLQAGRDEVLDAARRWLGATPPLTAADSGRSP